MVSRMFNLKYFLLFYLILNWVYANQNVTNIPEIVDSTVIIPNAKTDSNQTVIIKMAKSIRAMALDPKSQTKYFTNGWRAIAIPKGKFKLPPTSVMNKSNADQKKAQSLTSDIPSNLTSKPELSTKENSASKIESSAPTPSTVKDSSFSPKCLIDGEEYSNGETITTSDDPCIYCRCFYGKKMCQEQKCPLAPSLDCVAEQKVNQCCPLYTCKSTNNKSDMIIEDQPQTFKIEKSAIRRGPQYIGESPFSDDAELEQNRGHDDSRGKNPNEGKSPAVQSQRRISLLFNPLELIYHKPAPNRIHFPLNNNLNKPKNSIGLPSNLNGIDPFSAVSTSIFNRQLFEMLAKEKIPPINPEQNDPRPVSPNNSPIRTLPQSPIQMNISNVDEMRPITSSIPMIQQKFIPTTTIPYFSTAQPPVSTKTINLADIFQISGCNIYGKMYKRDEEIKELSNQCKTCVCASSGVKCLQKCP